MKSDSVLSAGIVGATVLVIAAIFGAGNASAAAAPTSAQARYEQDRANCMAGKTYENQQTCLKEAGARLQAAQKGDLSSPSSAQLAANAQKRCDVFKDAGERQSCIDRVSQDATVDGSVRAGGDIRSTTETVPGTPAPQPQGQ